MSGTGCEWQDMWSLSCRHTSNVFSVCGLLTQGHHNRMTKSLEMWAKLKLNATVFA